MQCAEPIKNFTPVYGAYAGAAPRGAALAFFLLFAPLLFSLVSCRKEHSDLPPTKALALSTDTITFDSVFIGHISSTRTLTLYNRSSRLLTIRQPYLGGGDASPFALLIDGRSPSVVHSLEIRPQDSLMILARVRPNLQLTDTLTRAFDSLVLPLEDGVRYVFLHAEGLSHLPFGMDTIRADLRIAGPPARLVQRTIFVPKGVTLTLDSGASLYFAPSAGLRVAGTLNIQGASNRPVVLAGQRLETYYRRKPGQWAGVALLPQSGSHAIDHALIRGAVTAIKADSLGLGNKLTVSNSTILYSSLEALDITESTLELSGSVLAQNFRTTLRLLGSTAALLHTTLFAYSAPPQVRSGPLIHMRASSEGTPNSLAVTNSIVWGDRETELQLTPARQPGLTLQVARTLFRIIPADTLNAAVWRYILIRDPLLEKPLEGECALTAKSPARGRGDVAQAAQNPVDMRGFTRLPSEGRPDLGALVYVEKE